MQREENSPRAPHLLHLLPFILFTLSCGCWCWRWVWGVAAGQREGGAVGSFARHHAWSSGLISSLQQNVFLLYPVDSVFQLFTLQWSTSLSTWGRQMSSYQAHGLLQAALYTSPLTPEQICKFFEVSCTKRLSPSQTYQESRPNIPWDASISQPLAVRLGLRACS